VGTVNALMDLAKQSLMADQAALNVVSNNVANQNTSGYTRQVVSWQTRDSVTIGSYTVGQGASVGSSSQRDRVLEQRLQQQIQVQAHSSSLASALQQVENIFSITSNTTSATSTPLGAALDSFFGALSALTAKHADSTTRQAVLVAAKNVADAFNSASNQLAGIAASLDQHVTSTVDRINSLTTIIADLNRKISGTSPDADAGVLEDQRQQAISELSNYVGLNQIMNEGNGLTLTTTSGAVLVSGGSSYAISTTLTGGAIHLVSSLSGQDVTNGLTGGSLGGVLEARDQFIPSFQTSLDSLAYDLATKLNQINSQGLDGSGNPGQMIFTLPSSSRGAAGQIHVASMDPNVIAAAGIGEGPTGNSNSLLLAGVANTAIVSGQTAVSFFTSFLASIGNAAADAAADSSSQGRVLTDLTSQRNALSAVSLDEEAANLTAYQRSYQAASKIFSIANDLMASAINLGTNSPVS